MLRYLLDEHIPPSTAAGIRAARAAVEVVPLREWRDGALISGEDGALLRAARDDGLTLVTFDLRTIPSLLKDWTEQGEAHGGVVLVPSATFRANDVGTLVRALVRLWDEQGADNWTDQVVFLKAVSIHP